MPPGLAPLRRSELDTDYVLYLVTDSSDAILRNRNLIDVVEKALEGGVSIVQYREKKLEAKAMVTMAIELRELCHRYNAKFIVNDRVDVAFAAGADGVHLGQDDISIKHARQILGNDAIIGISCTTVEEALEAVGNGADYLGVGAVYATSTKTNVSGIIGISGVRDVVSKIGQVSRHSRYVPCVAIGGLNSTNIQLLRYKSHTSDGYLEGVAVVSAIMGAEDVTTAAKDLRSMFLGPPVWDQSLENDTFRHALDESDVISTLARIAQQMVNIKPISHNMTNIVVANFAANVIIAAGSSPIMSTAPEEVGELAKLGGGLVVNLGSAHPGNLSIFFAGTQAYNKEGGPVLLDPVAVGATNMRYNMVSQLMNMGYFDIIKGNTSEIQALASGFKGNQKGVDSVEDDGSEQIDKVVLVTSLARRERCVVLMTGKTDYLSDGITTYCIQNGVESLSGVTGTGCALGSLVVAFAAVHKENKLLATLAAVLFYEIAAELGQENPLCQGPGHFIPCFLDALKHLSELCKAKDMRWLDRAKFETIHSADDL